MEHPVQIPSVGPSAMDQVALENVSVRLKPIHFAFDHGPGHFAVKEARPAITGLDSQGQITLQHVPIMV